MAINSSTHNKLIDLLAKGKGAHVVAVASGAHEPFLRELDADGFIDYTRSRPGDVAHAVDPVLNTADGRAGPEP